MLLFSGITDAGEVLNDDICRFILSLHSNVRSAKTPHDLSPLNEQHAIVKTLRLQHLEDTDAALLQREFRKFNNWADDRIEALESDYRDAKRAEKEIYRSTLEEGLSSNEVLHLQQELARAKKKVNRLKREMFDREEEIEHERDQMINNAKKQLQRNITEEEVFTISFELI